MKMNLGTLKKRCNATIEESLATVAAHGGIVTGKTGQKYGYIDRGPQSKILAVAHLDFVSDGRFWFEHTKVDNKNWIVCPVLDDRLGVYTILDFLPTLGVEVDVLFTEGEETGRSTAALFHPKKDYNWVVEFDRKGTDVVTYEYDWEDKLKPYFDIGIGSYSDISDLNQLGCMCMNVGIGYHNEHTKYSFMVVEEWASQMRKFAAFYALNKNTHFKYDWLDSKKSYRSKYSPYRSTVYSDWSDDRRFSSLSAPKKKKSKKKEARIEAPTVIDWDKAKAIPYPDDLVENEEDYSLYKHCEYCGDVLDIDNGFCYSCQAFQSSVKESEEMNRFNSDFDSGGVTTLGCENCDDSIVPGWIQETLEEDGSEVWIGCEKCNPHSDKGW